MPYQSQLTQRSYAYGRDTDYVRISAEGILCLIFNGMLSLVRELANYNPDCVGKGITGVISESLANAAAFLWVRTLIMITRQPVADFVSDLPNELADLALVIENTWPDLLPVDLELCPYGCMLERLFGLNKIADMISNFQVTMMPFYKDSLTGFQNCSKAFEALTQEYGFPTGLQNVAILIGAYSRWRQGLQSVFGLAVTAATDFTPNGLCRRLDSFLTVSVHPCGCQAALLHLLTSKTTNRLFWDFVPLGLRDMFTECEQARAFKALVLPKGSRDAKREGKKEGHPKQETLQVLAGASRAHAADGVAAVLPLRLRSLIVSF